MGKWVPGAGQKEMGYSIIEIMLAAALLGFIALALLPAVFALTDTAKVNAFRSVCNTMVKAKLQEYVSGVAATSAGADLGYIPSGFEYTKRRYQQQQTACQTNTIGSSPGFRERINSNLVVADTASQESGLSANMMGFQLYVLLRHYNPRVLVGGQPIRGCPPNDYQFYRLGDAIEVTVTGMIRTTPSYAQGGRGGRKFGNLQDEAGGPHPTLTCSASQVIYPPRLPFRYYLGNDGKLRNYQATVAFASGSPLASAEAMESHFRQLWSLDSGSTGTVNSGVIANTQSIAVSPDNQSVYVAKPGRLVLYHNCADRDVVMTDSSATLVTFEGTPDCASADFVEWPIDSNIENIAVDFGRLTDPENDPNEATPYSDDDRVFGLFNSGSATAGEIRLFDKSTGLWGAATDSTGAGFALPANRPTIRAIFITQSFPAVTKPNLFFLDNSCYTAGLAISENARWTHCASIFNSTDTNSAQDIRELPSQVEGVSY